MRVLAFAGVLAVTALPGPVQAAGSTMNGNSLLEYCDAPKGSPAWSVCFGYIQGAGDAFTASKGIEKAAPLYCLPAQATVGQVFDVAMAYLRGHPEKRQYDASSITLAALVEAFPCSLGPVL